LPPHSNEHKSVVDAGICIKVGTGHTGRKEEYGKLKAVVKTGLKILN